MTRQLGVPVPGPHSDRAIAQARGLVAKVIDDARRDGYMLARAQIARDLLAGEDPAVLVAAIMRDGQP